ncbi:lipid A export ATP-binding/permease MsbA domain protein [Desulfosporosinus sp. OT]|nr:lipid A export ATP-binding/permease MsbA domain protein [Desulfosporosinus sp. OT]
MFNTVQSALAGAERVFEILDYEEETADLEDSLEKLKDPAGGVAFHLVSFQVKPSEVIALLERDRRR